MHHFVMLFNFFKSAVFNKTKSGDLIVFLQYLQQVTETENRQFNKLINNFHAVKMNFFIPMF